MRKAIVIGAFITIIQGAWAQDACKSRGDLDPMYCDENGDLVADTPKDAKKLKVPGTLVFTYTPVEDPAVYEKIFKPFTDHLAQCVGKRVVFYQVQSNAAEIEAMRSGRLHVGGFSTGPTAFAVNIAGAVPFAIKGYEKDFQGYNLIVVVKKDSPFQKLSDLKGKKVAHTAPSSNSGHMAPMALFPKEASTPTRTTRSSSPASTTSRSSAWNRATTTRRRGLRRLPPHGRARPDQGRRLPRDLSQREVPDLVVRLRARPRARRSATRCSSASTTTASPRT
jgi:phosphate/phosphite/phosphonate ABC transporter binding protein